MEISEEPKSQKRRHRKRPSGTVTFLFTDIEQSSKLWQSYPDRMNVNVASHDKIMRDAIEANDGDIFKTVGDAFYAAFHTAPQALQAAVNAQKALTHASWGEARISVRMGLHTGDVNDRDNDYFGPTLSVVARLMSAGHGGQILLSRATADLLQGKLLEEISLIDLGEHRLKDIFEVVHIYQVNIPGLLAKFPPLRTMGLVNNNLPLNLTSFIGRDREMGEVQQVLVHNRLAILTGSGGTGKTRLALQVAANLQDQFKDGVWLIELAPLSEADHILLAFLAVLGLPKSERIESIELLLDYLRNKQMLIVLDNCEHLIAESARVTNAILAAAPMVRIIATSREVLGVPGERVYRVPSMDSPDPMQLPSLDNLPQYESIVLFVERAQAASSDFELTENNALFVAQICRRLDGIPFAIELAAALIDEMSPKTIATHLDDRFTLLTNRSRNPLTRHLTLRALLDWGYDLLSDAERTLLCRLSVFSDGWSLEGAEAICADNERLASHRVLPLLGRLIKKSLVLYSMNNDRYNMLETVRMYAMEKLGTGEDEVDTIHQRQIKYYLDFLRQHGNSFLFIESELSNLLSACNLCMKYKPEYIVEFSNLICEVLVAKGYFKDGIFLFNSGLQAIYIHNEPEIVAILNHNLGRCYFEMADFEKAKELFNLSLSTSSEALTTADNYFYLASVFVERADDDAAYEFIEKSRSLYLSLEHEKGLADTYYLEAYMNYYGDDLLKVQTLLNQALDMFEKSGHALGKLKCMHLLCFSFTAKNNPDRNKTENLAQAELVARSALELSVSMGELNYRASLLRASAEIAAAKKAYGDSYRYALEALELAAKFGDKKLQAQTRLLLCRNFIEQEDYLEGINWGGKALSLFQDVDDLRGIAYVQKEFCLAYHGLNNIQASINAGLESQRLFTQLNDHFQMEKLEELLKTLRK